MKKYIAFILVIALFLPCIVLTSHINAQNIDNTDDIIQAFKKLEARLESGITYEEYLKMLGEINYQLKELRDFAFTFNASINKAPAIMSHSTLCVILGNYTLAGSCWHLCIKGIKQHKFPNDERFLKSMNLYKPVKDGGVLIKTEKGTFVDSDAMRNCLWIEASKELRDFCKERTEREESLRKKLDNELGPNNVNRPEN